MCQNARKMHHSEAKKSKNFLKRGRGLFPRPLPIGEGNTPSSNPTPSRLLRSTSNENPGSASVCVESKKFLILYYATSPTGDGSGRGCAPSPEIYFPFWTSKWSFSVHCGCRWGCIPHLPLDPPLAAAVTHPATTKKSISPIVVLLQ